MDIISEQIANPKKQIQTIKEPNKNLRMEIQSERKKYTGWDQQIKNCKTNKQKTTSRLEER